MGLIDEADVIHILGESPVWTALDAIERIRRIRPVSEIVTYCDVNKCEDCPRYADDCDGKMEEPIVRCKNCRYCKMKRSTFKGEPYIYYKCEELDRVVEEDEYCSWGDEK